MEKTINQVATSALVVEKVISALHAVDNNGAPVNIAIEQLTPLLPKGDKGDKGDTGAQGEQGIQGIEGDKGETGATGAQGVQGIQGEKGDKGETGEVGAVGLVGPKGDKGETGATGAQGIQGVQGVAGRDGATGAAGRDGHDGTNGIDGKNGAKGADGAKGDQGPAGAPASMDYSILTEQIVPGEFWPDENGAKRQVYVKRYVGTLPTEPPTKDCWSFQISNQGEISPVIVIGRIGTYPMYSGARNCFWSIAEYHKPGILLSLPPYRNVNDYIPNALWGSNYDIVIKYVK